MDSCGLCDLFEGTQNIFHTSSKDLYEFADQLLSCNPLMGGFLYSKCRWTISVAIKKGVCCPWILSVVVPI